MRSKFLGNAGFFEHLRDHLREQSRTVVKYVKYKAVTNMIFFKYPFSYTRATSSELPYNISTKP